MKKILILVEGQTEETFVKTVLAPYLWEKEILCISKLATTKRVKSGPDFKGGIVSYERVKRDLRHLLKDTSVQLVTTMIDYYGFSSLVPFEDAIRGKSCFERVETLEELFKNDIDNYRFLPYLQLHEFEMMLFVSPGTTADTLKEPGKKTNILKIRNYFPTPEEINDNPKTAPSKRLNDIFPGYQKVFDGPRIVQRIGLDNIRRECKHFDSWVSQLEAQ